MKLSAPSFKNLNFKQLLLAHGEKFAIGLVGLIALVALLRTPWTSYQELPAKLQQEAKDADARIRAAKWPDEEKRKFSADDTLGAQLAVMDKPIDLNRLKYSTDLSFELYLRAKRHDDPQLQTIEYLIASAHRFSIPEHIDISADTENDPEGIGLEKTDGNQPSVKSSTRKVRVRKRTTSGVGSPMGTGGSTLPMAGSGSGTGGSGPPGMGGSGAPGMGGSGAPGMEDGDAGEGGFGAPGMGGMGMGTGDEGGGSGGSVQPRGHNVVAVRGVFKIYKQLAAYIQALDLNLSLDNPSDRAIVRSYVKILNFRLQRRVSIDGGKLWGDWQMVDISPTLDYFSNKVAEWEPDVVEQRITHFKLTFPLPRRLRLEWGPAATHPYLKAYQLDSEARQQQEKINQLAVEESERRKKEGENVTPKYNEPSLSEIRKNIGSARQQMVGSADGSKRMMDSLQRAYDPKGQNKDKLAKIKAQVTAVGNLFLFRYFDFDVTPGLGYQYRVKVVFQNPNFGKLPSQLVAGKGNTRFEYVKESVYSRPTQAAFVPSEAAYFLTRANRNLRETSLLPTSVSMDILQWIPDLGAVVRGKLRKLSVGQMVGGVDPSTERVDLLNWVRNPDEETTFHTDVILIDVAGGGKPVSEEIAHDLKLSTRQKGTAGIRNEVVVVDELGRLKRLNKGNARRGLKSANADWNGVEGTIPLAKNTNTGKDGMTEGPSLDDLNSGAPGMGDMIDGSGKKPRKSRRRSKRSPLRKKSSKKGAGGRPKGYPGPPGMAG